MGKKQILLCLNLNIMWWQHQAVKRTQQKIMDEILDAGVEHLLSRVISFFKI